MSDTLDVGGPRLLSGIAPREWSLRRKVALAVLIPIALAAIFGGLRVRNDLSEADNYSASASRVTVLGPATDYLAAIANAAVVSLRKGPESGSALKTAVAEVDAAAAVLEESLDGASLTTTQRERAESILSLTEDARSTSLYASRDQSVAVLRRIQISVNQLIAAIVADQIEPDARLQVLDQVLGGRISLALQQFAVADDGDAVVRPYDLAAEIGIESAAINRVGVVVGSGDPDFAALRSQNAGHLSSIRSGGADMGDETAYLPYDSLTAGMLKDIDGSLAAAADESQSNALLNSIITLAALLAAILLALFVSRLLLDPIRRLREGALEVAQERLPEAVRTIRAGGDPGAIVPIDVTTQEEMGQLARAVDSLHQEAVNLAAGEAKLREQVGEMFVTLSRRNTSLINQQLGLIETLEKDEEDPKRLESLFRLDHLASRMRRTADSLNVLADAPAAAGDPQGLGVSDVLQAALAGVQEYQRVQIDAAATERVAGRAASDTVHLVTELIDNALAYSPPSSMVTVTTKKSPEGVVVKVSDAGLGMKDDAMAALNDELRSGGEVNAETARRMGLLVVSRLAKRHGIFVELERNTRGGVTASVVLPTAMLRLPGQSAQQPDEAPVRAAAPTNAGSASAAFAGAASAGSAAAGSAAAGSASAAFANAEPTHAATPATASATPTASAAATPAPAPLPVRQKPGGVPAPAAGLAARLQSMREAREAANLGNPGTPVSALSPPLLAAAPIPKDQAAGRPDSIEAAINAVIRLPQRRPGTSDVPGEIAPVAPAPVVDQEPVAQEPVVVPVVEPVVEPAAEPLRRRSSSLEPVVIEAPDPVVIEAPEPVVIEAPEPVVIEAPKPLVAVMSPIPAATTSFSVLDAGSPMPDLLPEDGSIFAAMKSNFFSSDGGEPWSTNEVDSGWQTADRVAEATPLQISETGLPMRRPGSRIVPGGVTPRRGRRGPRPRGHPRPPGRPRGRGQPRAPSRRRTRRARPRPPLAGS